MHTHHPLPDRILEASNFVTDLQSVLCCLLGKDSSSQDEPASTAEKLAAEIPFWRRFVSRAVKVDHAINTLAIKAFLSRNGVDQFQYLVQKYKELAELVLSLSLTQEQVPELLNEESDLHMRLDDHWRKTKTFRTDWDLMLEIVGYDKETVERQYGAAKKFDRVWCDKTDHSVYLDDRLLHRDLSEELFEFFKLIASAYPKPITFAEMMGKCLLIQGKNSSRLRGQLPVSLSKLVTSGVKGYQLRLPPQKRPR